MRYSTTDAPHWKVVHDIVHYLHRQEVGSHVSKRDLDVALRAALPDPALRAFCLTNYENKAGAWKIPLQHICDQLHALADFKAQGVYEGDVFFIHGGQSRFVRSSYLPTIQSLFPNHMLTTVRGAGHWIHAEAPEDTIALLKKYLDR